MKKMRCFVFAVLFLFVLASLCACGTEETSAPTSGDCGFVDTTGTIGGTCGLGTPPQGCIIPIDPNGLNGKDPIDVGDVEVVVGQTFEWNDQSATEETQEAWRTGGGKSPDGLWKYQIYVPQKSFYLDVVFSEHGYAWHATPGSTGLGYARARDYGFNFHPAEMADIVKTFYVPADGTISVDTTIARVNEWVQGNGTPTSFAIYLDDKLVYPSDGSRYQEITSTTPLDISVELEVQKNQALHIHIGCVNDDQSSDAVNMINSVFYLSLASESGGDSNSVSSEKLPYGAVSLSDVGDFSVSVGQEYQWEVLEDLNENNGVSPDGLWQVMRYVFPYGRYLRSFSTAESGLEGNVYKGSYFSPAITSDLAKVFSCPSGGTVRLEVTLSEGYTSSSEGGNGYSFSVYSDGKLIYPADGSVYYHYHQQSDFHREITLDVKKNQRIYLQVGSLGNNRDAAVKVQARVVYEAVNDEVALYENRLICSHEEMTPYSLTYEPSCTESGCETSKCKKCPYTLARSGPAAAHSYSLEHSLVIKEGSLSVRSWVKSPCTRCFSVREQEGYAVGKDGATGISVSLKTPFAYGTEMKVTPLTASSEDYGRLVSRLAENEVPLFAYEILFYMGKTELSLSGDMIVTIPRKRLPSEVKVLVLTANGEVSDGVVSVTEDSVSFTMPRCGGSFVLY